MYKYLKEYQGQTFERVHNNILKYTDIDKFLNEQLRKQKNTYRKTYAPLDISKIIELEGFDLAYRKLIFLNENEIDCAKLLSYLRKLLKNNAQKLLHGNSELKRLIRMYDLVKYK